MATRRIPQILLRMRKPLLALASTCLALLLAEAAVRMFLDTPRIHDIAVSEIESPYRRSDNPILRYELKPDFYCTHPGGDARTNADGQRDKPWQRQKPPGRRRIILLGDSVVELINYVGDEHTIDRELEKRFPDGEVEVMNFGVAGYCTRAEVELLKVKGLRYRPDTVVIVFVENDFQNFNPEHALQGGFGPRPAWVQSLFHHSHFFRLLCLRLNWFRYGDEFNPQRWNQQALGDNNVADGLRLLRQLADQHDFEPILGVWPAFTDAGIVDKHFLADGSGQLVVERLAWANGIPTFRFSPRFRSDWQETGGVSPRKSYTALGDGMHPSPAGTEIAAQVLYEVLTGRQPTELVEVPAAADEVDRVASVLGQPFEPPDPLLDRNPAYAALLKQARPQAAEDYIRRRLETDPGDADAWCILGAIHARQGELTDAGRCYERALQAEPKHVEALTWNGVVAASNRQWDRAIDLLAVALEQDPQHARAHFHRGLAVAGAFDVFNDQAEWHLRQAIAAFPRYLDAHNELCKLYIQRQDWDAAALACQAAIELAPGDALPRYHQGMVLAMQNRPDQAEENYQAALQLDPEFAEAHLALGVLYRRSGKYGAAIKHLRKAAQRHPDWADATTALAWLLATVDDQRLRNGSEALQWASKAAEQLADHRALQSLAAAHAEQGDFSAAISHQQQALQRAPEAERRAMQLHLETYQRHQPVRVRVFADSGQSD